jgi:hypothetical protein
MVVLTVLFLALSSFSFLAIDGAGHEVGKRKRIRTAAAEMAEEQKRQRKTSSSRRTAGCW